MKRLVYTLLIALVCVGCKSNQNLINGNEQLLTVPCASIVSDQFATRALGTANSTNLQNAKDKAIAVARRELVSSMQTSVQRIIDTYATSCEEDMSARFQSYTKDVSRLTSNQMLVGSTIACEKITQSVDKKTKNVIYHAYVVVEVDNAQLQKTAQQQILQSLPETDALRNIFREGMGK